MRNKNGQFVKGCKRPDITGENHPLFGKVKSSETLKRMSDAQKGKKLSEETKQKISNALKGDKSYLWKDGRTDDVGYTRTYAREKARRIRMATLEALGGKCVRCHFSDYRALQIDHVNGDGYEDRKVQSKKCNSSYYLLVLESFIKEENRYQLLCANCNWIKRVENGEQGYRKYKNSDV